MTPIAKVAILFLAVTVSNMAADDTKLKSAPPYGITLIPIKPVIRSFAEYSQSMQCDLKGFEVKSAEIEIRRLGPIIEVVRFPFLYSLGVDGEIDKRRVRVEGWRNDFSVDDLRRLGDTPSGEYRLAMYLNGQRASNVVAVRIDPNPPPLPILQIEPLEPYPGQDLASVVLRFTGPNPYDDRFRDVETLFAPILVDGFEINRGTGYSGPNSGLGPGTSICRVFRLTHGMVDNLVRRARLDDPARLDPAKPHTYELKFAGYEAVPLTLDPTATPLADEWDAVSNRFTDKKIPTFLQGRVYDAKGHPAAGYEVRLGKYGSERFKEITDEEGAYSFPGAVEGWYSLHCTPPPPAGSPVIGYEEIHLTDQSPIRIDFSFLTPYKIGGKVEDKQGRPLAKVEVMTTWKDEDTGTEFNNFGVTGVDGSYSISGPFKTVSYVSPSSGGGRAVLHDVKAGSRKVNFTIEQEGAQ